MTFLIRDARVAEEIAAQAGTEETPPFELNTVISPVIFGPQRPPLATSGYFPFTIGNSTGAVALNTSQQGIFVSGTNQDSIVRINRISIFNPSGAGLVYTIRRVDDASGFTLAAVRPGYINAGNTLSGGVFFATRTNTVGPNGFAMVEVLVEGGSVEHFDGPWIVNNGAVVVAPTVVNTAVRTYFLGEHWPSIRRQRAGG